MEQFNILSTMASTYYSMYVIDLLDDTVIPYHSKNKVEKEINVNLNAGKNLKESINKNIVKSHLQTALEFTNLSTLSLRMKGKKNISLEVLDKKMGWMELKFTTIDSDSSGRPTKVVFTVRIIDEEKKEKEELFIKSNTDELTGFYNRRAYEYAINTYETKKLEKDFVYVSIDINGLKIANDSHGHAAGDELIIGASECMNKTLGKYGKLYRTGGDEFVALIHANKKQIELIKTEIDEEISRWSGKLIKNASLSCGFIAAKDYENASINKLASEADSLMYEVKASYYRKKGYDRRGQNDAHTALYALYTKILKINITNDTYQIINLDKNELEQKHSKKISTWLKEFGKSGYVHPDDMEEYLRLTDIKYMKQYFKSDKTSLHIFYKRKMNNKYIKVMMEIIRANDYTDKSQSLYLYVKDIDK